MLAFLWMTAHQLKYFISHSSNIESENCQPSLWNLTQLHPTIGHAQNMEIFHISTYTILVSAHTIKFEIVILKPGYYLRMSLAQVQWAHKECKLYPFLYSASNKGQFAACVSKILFPWETQIYKSNPDDNWTAVLGCVTNLLEGKHSWNWHLYLWDEWETRGGNDHWTWGCQHTGDYIQ